MIEHTAAVPFRPMFKFQFCRTIDPSLSGPSWDHRPSDVPTPFSELLGPGRASLAPCCESSWDWLLGTSSSAPDPSPAAGSTAEVAGLLRAAAEETRVSNAFVLARRRSAEAVAALSDALVGPAEEATMRAAMHGLGAAGDIAVPSLLAALGHSSEQVVGRAAEALGEGERTVINFHAFPCVFTAFQCPKTVIVRQIAGWTPDIGVAAALDAAAVAAARRGGRPVQDGQRAVDWLDESHFLCKRTRKTPC